MPDDPSATATLLAPLEPMPAPGELGIREKRSWRSWQLAAVALLTFIVGLWVESFSHEKNVVLSSRGYNLPPEGSSASSNSGGATGSSVPSGTSSANSSSTSTTTVPTTTTTPASATSGPSVVLVPRYESVGSWTSPPFTVTAGTWDIGWAYQCAQPPASGSGFVVTVSPSNTTAVTGTGASGQGVTPVSSNGSQTISVQGAPSCQWVVKVTGVGTPAA